MAYFPACPNPVKLLLLASMAAFDPSNAAEDISQRVDYLSFAQGAVPVAFAGDAKALGVGLEHALLAIDGNAGSYVLTPKPGGAQTRITFVYKLPALTTFNALFVPNVLETPSPSQTFVRKVEIAGSDSGPEGTFHVLGGATLDTHPAKGRTTAIPIAVEKPVRWVRVTLEGGIDIRRDKTFFEFSEIIGHGTQEPVPLSEAFRGKWKGRGVLLELKQEGASVSGCYDGEGDIKGTVSGNLLRATGKTRMGGIPSAFVLAVGDNGGITGVRSTNGAPFRRYSGVAAPGIRTECSGQGVQPLGCGSIIHGINFDFDSATIRPESGRLLETLAAGLRASAASAITVIGHTSSEGSDAYNDTLSRRRAEAVAAAIAERGIGAGRVSAKGRGEKQPIADNVTEAGRSLNRRVEIACR
ncbi:MAG: OmpA family protein [Rhodocyclaceae bacterium]|jgi:outer membrane protein OmpA-like peptidoglycan-associated protein